MHHVPVSNCSKFHQNVTQICPKLWMLLIFFFFFFLQQRLLENVTRRLHSFWAFLRKIITTCDKTRMFHKFKNIYYKMWQKILQSVTNITKWLVRYFTNSDIYYKAYQKSLQSVASITKCGSYYKVRRSTLWI